MGAGRSRRQGGGVARWGVWAAGLVISWFGMLAAHEMGHALHAWVSGGRVDRVVIPLVGFSRTDVALNPHPRFVAWGGAVWGSVIPLAAWGAARWLRLRREFRFAFFAGFCLTANGAYLGAGVMMPAGDTADLIELGTPRWVPAAAGAAAVALGLWVWHRLGVAPSRERSIPDGSAGV